jgi:CHAD domain-containing protein
MTSRYEPGESVRAGFRRVQVEEIARVRAGLTGAGFDRDVAIHEARQSFKRLRGLTRLASRQLGSDFRSENCRWRDAGRLLSGSRDATVVLQCFDRLMANSGDDWPRRDVQRLRSLIAGSVGRDGVDGGDTKLAEVLNLLDEGETTIGKRAWPGSKQALLAGFRRGQKRLRRGWRKASRHPEADALHSWRKRIKEQTAQLRVFRSVIPHAFRSRITEAKKTAELLGEDHDLFMLAECLRTEAPPAFTPIRDALLTRITDRREALQKEAFSKGTGFSSERPSAFAEELACAWEKKARRRRRRRIRGPQLPPISLPR